MIHRICFGLRARDPARALDALRRIWPRGARATVQDAGEAGLWVHVDAPELAKIAEGWAIACGAPVRVYGVCLTGAPEGVAVRAWGRSHLADGRTQPIASATEDDLQPTTSAPLAEQAEAWLQIALEIHEQLDDADSSVTTLP
ncbi:MAG TPA: hypothetical protein ENK18_07795 [Deltaproteobacteria bacterium]|nr:hypothetical protein [Deltaproteobacteria bacterium]